MPTLTHIMFAGEKLPTKYLIQWMNQLPHSHFYNAYGPTEATGASTCYKLQRIPELTQSIPIGTPRFGTRVDVLRSDFTICETKELGELAISGHGLAKGYWNDAVRTDTAFVNINGQTTYLTGDLGFRDENDQLHFRERKDHQIKIQGYRIELGEVNNAALAIGLVAEAAALAIANDKGDQELVLAICLSAESDFAGLRKELSLRLPKYMMPKRIKIIDKLPRTDRGKIDLPAIAQLFTSI